MYSTWRLLKCNRRGLFQEKFCWGRVEQTLKMGVPPTQFSRKKGVGGWNWTWKWGYHQPNFIFFVWYSPYGYSWKHSHPPNFNWFQFHPRCPFSWNSPKIKCNLYQSSYIITAYAWVWTLLEKIDGFSTNMKYRYCKKYACIHKKGQLIQAQCLL